MKLRNIKLFVLMLFAFASFTSIGQIQVSGVVTDGTGEPLIGAYVLEQNTTNGTTTDIDGRYSISIAPDGVLVISYIGMQEQAVPVDARSEIDIILTENSEMLDEVVVVGYGTQKRSNISGSVSVVTAEEITSTPSLRVEQALQGRTAGVQISQNSGSPGSALTVRIRGTGTITNSDPLYVVDGIIVQGLDFLNTNDVESISVLKDGAAAAVYGARAANGVVLITTKTGSKNRTGSISYSTYVGSQTLARELDLLTAREYAVISNEAAINSGTVPNANLRDPSIFGEGTDWQGAIFQSAPIRSHNINMSGGGDGMNFGLSGSYFLQDGIIGGDKSRFERYTLRSVVGYEVKPWLTIGSNIGFTNLIRDQLQENNEFTSPVVQALNMDPLTPVRKPDGTYAYSDFVDTDIRNPVNAIENTYSTYTGNRVVGSVDGVLKLSEHLKFKSAYSVDATFAEEDGFIPIYNLSIDSIDAPTAERNDVNSVFLGRPTYKNWQWENLAMYDRTFGDHKLGVVLGTSANYGISIFTGGANTNLPSNDPEDALISNTVDPIDNQSAFESEFENTFFSYISKVDYEYKDRYLFTGSFRADGSSKFGENKRFGYFPAVSVGWVVNREDFWDYSAFSLFKIRGSWGMNGNDRIGDYGFTSVVFNGQNYVFGSGETITNGAVALTVANPDLQWETVIQTNIGVDMELWDGRLSVIADYYIKDTEDMLYQAPIPGVVGASAPFRNIGEVRNTGLELFLQTRGKLGKLSYDLSGNVSWLSNEVTFLGGGNPTFSGFVQGRDFVSRTEVGQPIASFYGYQTDGLFQTVEEVENHAFQTAGTAPGDIRFKDLNEDGVINADDRTFLGDPSPDMIYGFNVGLDYGGFDLSAFIQGVYGNQIFNASVRYDKIGGNRPASILERWTGPGTSNFEPRVGTADPNNNARVSDRFIEDGSFIRLKNIQLGYTMPSQWTDKVNIKKLRVYVSGQNLLTSTSYTGYDPEIGTRGPLEIGIDRGFYPSARTVLGGVQVDF